MAFKIGILNCDIQENFVASHFRWSAKRCHINLNQRKKRKQHKIKNVAGQLSFAILRVSDSLQSENLD